MTTHPSEHFVASYLAQHRWTLLNNVRVKLSRNWTDLDVVATPTGAATRPCWLPAPDTLHPQFVQVKWRAQVAWDLGAANYDDVLSYLWPEGSRRPVLEQMAKIAAGPFDWALLATDNWVADGKKLKKLADAITTTLRRINKNLQNVRFESLENVSRDFANQCLRQHSLGWADDPYVFHYRLLQRSELLALADLPTTPPPLQAIEAAISRWLKRQAPIAVEAADVFDPLSLWLSEIGLDFGTGGAPFTEAGGKAKDKWDGVYVCLSRGYYVGFTRYPNDNRVDLEIYRGARYNERHRGWRVPTAAGEVQGVLDKCRAELGRDA